MRTFILTALCLLSIPQAVSAQDYTLQNQTKSVIERRAENMKLRPNVGVIVASDTQREESGIVAAALLKAAGFKVVKIEVVKNLDIKSAIAQMLADDEVQAILAIGGTGISPHDVTVDAIDELSQKHLPGYGEYFRALTRERWEKEKKNLGLLFMDTRANAGVAQGKIIFGVPGSPDATDLAVREIIIPSLPTLYGQLQKKS